MTNRSRRIDKSNGMTVGGIFAGIGGLELGFKWVESGPLVRSSYRAETQVRELSKLNFIHMRSESTASVGG